MLNMIRIGPRLALTFALGLGMLALACLVSLREMQNLNAKTVFVSEHVVPSLRIQHAVALELSAIRRAEVRHVLSDSPAEMTLLESQIKTYNQSITELLNEYASHYVTDKKDAAGLDETLRLLRAHESAMTQLLTVSRQKTRSIRAMETASDLLKGETLRSYEAVQKGLDDWWTYNLTLADHLSQDARQTYESTRDVLLGMLALFLLMGSVSAWLITRSVVKPLNMAVAAADAAMQGDLTQEPHIQGKDEAAGLLTSICKMNDGLSSLVRDVRRTSESLLRESRDLAQDSTDLSRRTEQQAVALEETSVSIGQIQTAMQRNADSARRTAELTRTASDTAQQGSAAIQQVNSRMGEIVSSTRQITEIISMIDAMSFQINLLALNASVEAARAGASGKGFAVVASEVRSLAQRSAESAGAIRNKIRYCVEEMESGAELVATASSSINNIVNQISEASSLVNEISDTVIHQAESFTHVAIAVKTLQNMTEDNVSLVEQGAAAASGLKNQAQTLRGTVERFKLPTYRPTQAAA